jgi:arylsulfatase
VLPLDDRQIERINSDLAGRPVLIKGNSQVLFAGMGRLSENSVINIKNKSFSVTSDLEVPAKGAEGVIIAQGGRFGGWSLYAKGGKAKFLYNVLGIKSFSIEATKPVPSGKTQVRMEFAYDGGGMGRGGNVTLYCDGKQVGKGRVEQTQGFIFSADETTDVGYESGTTVSPDYTAHTSRFNGKINWVQIDVGKDAQDADHYISPEERIRVAMARQ